MTVRPPSFRKLLAVLARWLLPAMTAAIPVAAQTPPAAPATRPNVLFIVIDDLRDWVGFAGRNPQTRTPAIDRLARRGVAFTRAYCAAPICNPSRAAVMSGLRPSTTGIYDNRADWRTVIPANQTLPGAFRRGGYFVCGAGKIYHGLYERFEEWDDYLKNWFVEPDEVSASRRAFVPQGRGQGVGAIKFAPLDCRDEDLPDWRIVDYGIAQLQRSHDRPFFLTIGLTKPHMPWFVPQRYYDRFPVEQIALPPHLDDDLDDVPEAGVHFAQVGNDHRSIVAAGRWREAVQGYLAAIAYADMNIGRLLDALEQSAYRDNTIVCLWSDHGWHLGEKRHWRKSTLWEEATRSPMVWVVPGVTPVGAPCAQPVELLDIFPTLADLCGLPAPSHAEGVSLRPLLADPRASWERPAVTTHAFGNHAVRSAGWRYIRYEDGSEELYDETSDPNEWRNLAGDPRQAARKAGFARWLPTCNHPTLRTPEGPGTRDSRRDWTRVPP